jgi:NADH:ubiquinone oxidoreductase subunit 6 (subunit J)
MTGNLFYFLTFITLFAALGVVFSKNPVYSVLCLILTFFCLSGHYVLLNAQFVAAVNIIVYAGAIMVLFLFVIMFLNGAGPSSIGFHESCRGYFGWAAAGDHDRRAEGRRYRFL